MRTFRILSGVLLVVLLSLTSVAQAENPQRAKASYKEGLLLYNLGDYEKALEKFKNAYLDLPDPAFLFNLAQCQRQIGQYANASKSYRAFLREGTNLSTKVRDDVQRLISEMDEAVREARRAAPPTGTQPPSGEPIKPEPPPPPPPPTTGNVITAPPPPAPRPWYKNPAGMTLTFGGVALAIVGGGLLGGSASANSNAINAMTLPDQRSSHDSAVTFQSAGIAFLVIGGAAAVTGAVILGVGAKKKAVSQ